MTAPSRAPEPPLPAALAPLIVEALPPDRGAAVSAALGAWDWPYPADAIDVLAAAGRVFAARDGQGRPLGVMVLGEFDGAIRLSALAVAPARRRRGVATALLARAVEVGRREMSGAIVAVSPGEAGRAFLVKRGFLHVDPERVSGRHRRLARSSLLYVRSL